ncbi:hypothetical protein KIW84_045110 [Lathyrus oleraceus]|uniref:Uncharacterized protein n=1 Tax=Pisum sativum TaxID=3888 RepID=A0A9D5AWB4_PEA|nr:hypothetical protein KIW84_045110 [Pisum sativum]
MTDFGIHESKVKPVLEPCKGHLKRKFIKECWSKCGCRNHCGNQIVQRGLTCNFQDTCCISAIKTSQNMTINDHEGGSLELQKFNAYDGDSSHIIVHSLPANSNQVDKLSTRFIGKFLQILIQNVMKLKAIEIHLTCHYHQLVKTTCSFALPHIMGWDRLTNQKPSETVSFQPNRQLGGTVGFQPKMSPQILDLEWENERIKQQMQIGSHYRNCWDALIGIIRSGGLFSLYAGWKAVLCRNIPQQQIQAKPRPPEKNRV